MGNPNDSIVASYEVIDNNFFDVEIDSTIFAAGQYVTLYPMVRFRHPGEEWQIIPPTELNLTVGRDDKGRFFMRSNQKDYDMQLADIGITKGTGRLDDRSDLTIRVRNNESSDYIGVFDLIPVYLGHVNPREIGMVQPLAYGEMMKCGGYIPANGEGDVTFSFVPEYGGITVFVAYVGSQYIGELAFEMNNDKLTDYTPYLENKSYLTCEGDQWYWNVELADRIGAKMSHWVPSDNLHLRVLYYCNGQKVNAVKKDVSLRKYLAALPDNIGTGQYTFTYRMPVDVSKPGEYCFESYLADNVNNELFTCCGNTYSFTVEGPTGIEDVETENGAGAVYDLQGRPLSGKPARRGLYIQGKKKIYIK